MSYEEAMKYWFAHRKRYTFVASVATLIEPNDDVVVVPFR